MKIFFMNIVRNIFFYGYVLRQSLGWESKTSFPLCERIFWPLDILALKSTVKININ